MHSSKACVLRRRSLCGLTAAAALLFGLFVFPPPLGADALKAGDGKGLEALIDENLKIDSSSTAVVDYGDFRPFLEYAVEKGYHVFELLNLAYPHLVERKIRLRIPGEVMKEVKKHYFIGGSKMQTIIPFDRLTYIELGYTGGGKNNAMDVHINDEYETDFYGFGTLHEERHFGFRRIELNYYRDAFGMKAKRFLFSFQVSHLHLYEPELVAIHLRSFPKAKRENFWRIKKK
jgi:hypothetical protein